MGGDTRSDVSPPLPLVFKDFEAFVQKLSDETDGSETAMAMKLQPLGFSCTPVSKSISFACVRFGCRKGGFFRRASLLQWFVSRWDVASGKIRWTASAMDYSWLKGCYPEKDIEEAQTRFLFRSQSQ
jgi:hypothetical protein